MNFTKISVGDKLDALENVGEGVFFSATYSGYVLIFNFHAPTDKEVKAVSSGSHFEMRYSVFDDRFLIVTAKAGSMEWMDAPYDPHLEKQYPEISTLLNTNGGASLTVILSDANTGTIKHFRFIRLDGEFSAALLKELDRIYSLPFDPKQYTRNIQIIQATHSIDAVSDRYIKKFSLTDMTDQKQSKETPETRRSLAGLNKNMFRKDNYPGLPDTLKEFNYWIADTGHCLMSVPRQLLAEMEETDMDMLEVPIPVKFVLEKGYDIIDNHIVIDVKYDKTFGVMLPDGYSEF